MTNSMRVILSVFTLLLLCACSSPKGYMSHPNYQTLNSALYDDSFPHAIADDGSSKDLVFKAAFNADENYLKKYTALNALDLKKMSFEDICKPENQKVIEEYLAASPIHLHLTFVIYSCAKKDGDTEREAKAHKAFKRAVQFVQNSGSGLTPNDPIQLTDYQDIELLSYVTETNILGVDISPRSNGTLIKAHTYDRAYQRFEYRYYSMSKYLQSKIAPLTGSLAPVNVLNMLREASLHPKSSNIGLVLRAKQQFSIGKYEFVSILTDNAIKKMDKENKSHRSYFDNYPLIITLRFQSLLAQNKLDEFDQQIDKLDSEAAKGSIEAMALLSLRELFNDTANNEAIQQNLDEISYIYEQDSAELILLTQILMQPTYEQLLTRWLGETPTDNQLNAVLEMSRRYKFGQTDDFDSQRMRTLINTAHKANVDGSKTQMAFLMRFLNNNGPDFSAEHQYYDQAATETKNPEYRVEALYQLADIYYYGNSSIQTDKNKALSYYQQAASNGHMQAAYNLATHYMDKDFPSLTHQQVAELLQKAAPIRPDAYCMLGDLLTQSDKKAAKNAYIKGASRAQPSCAFQLGMLEKQAENYRLAGYWFRKSARSEYLPAIEQLALLYQNGQGTKMNLQKAEVLRNYLNAIPFE